MKKIAALVALLALTIIGVAYADSLPKVWTSHETLKSTDLNADFAHVHTLMVGGGNHNTLVDADVNASAAIQHSKLATPALLPKAWAYVGSAVCDGAASAGTACTLADSSQVNSITSNATAGQYRLRLSYVPANASFGVFVTSGTVDVVCSVASLATCSVPCTNALITCRSVAGTPAATNAAFSVLVMDT